LGGGAQSEKSPALHDSNIICKFRCREQVAAAWDNQKC
jgi:hypothetical protein